MRKFLRSYTPHRCLPSTAATVVEPVGQLGLMAFAPKASKMRLAWPGIKVCCAQSAISDEGYNTIIADGAGAV